MNSSPQAAIPLVDLGAQHLALKAEIDAAFARVIAASAFILGAEVESFEQEIARHFGARHAIGVSNGTDAIALALRALGIGAGDEVLVPSWSFIASATAVRMAGAMPVFVDIDPRTHHMDPERAREAIGARTRAVVPVHLYGQTVDLGPFQELARRHGLKIVEDACQAHGARVGPVRAGAVGDAGCFSFYPSKNLGAMGDAGLVVTNDDSTAETLRRLRSHGEVRKYDHAILGFNHRLDAIQAAVLRVKLPHLDAWNQRRREIAAGYNRELQGLDLTLPEPAPGRDHVYHVYVIRTRERDALREHLGRHGIGTVIHYPSAIHQQPAYAEVPFDRSRLGESERAGPEVLSLPLYPELSGAQIARVVAAVRSFFRR